MQNTLIAWQKKPPLPKKKTAAAPHRQTLPRTDIHMHVRTHFSELNVQRVNVHGG